MQGSRSANQFHDAASENYFGINELDPKEHALVEELCQLPLRLRHVTISPAHPPHTQISCPLLFSHTLLPLCPLLFTARAGPPHTAERRTAHSKPKPMPPAERACALRHRPSTVGWGKDPPHGMFWDQGCGGRLCRSKLALGSQRGQLRRRWYNHPNQRDFSIKPWASICELPALTCLLSLSQL